MSKRKSKIKFSIKKPDITSLDRNNDNFMSNWWRVETYLRYEVKAKALKSEVIKWLKSHKKDVKPYNVLEDWKFQTLGKLCYVLNRGGDIPPEGEPWIEKELKALSSEGKIRLKEKKKEEKSKETAPKKTIQDYLHEKAASVCGEEIEAIIDEFIINPKKFKANNYDPLAQLRKHNLSAGHARHILKFYEPEYERINSALQTFNTRETKEYYGHYTEAQLKQFLYFYEKVIDAANIIIDRAKAKRKPRKKRNINPEKLISKVKYAKEDSSVGLASVNPIDILGSKELWFYNSKTRKLGKYVALDASGLSIKGTSMVNFSVDKSVQKTLRKPKEQLREFKSGGTRKLNRAFNEIKTVDTKVKPRLNSNMVIFKVFK